MLTLSAALTAGALWAPPVRAQVAGGVRDVTTEHTFTAVDEPMWGPGQPPDFHVRFFDLFFDTGTEEGEEGAFADTDVGTFGVSVGGKARAAFGISAGADFTAGRVDLAYPLSLKLTFPEPNSFRDGEEIRILTSAVRMDGGDITTREPSGSVDITGRIGFHATADAKVCVFACGGLESLGPVEYPGGFTAVADTRSAAEAAAASVPLFKLASNTLFVRPSPSPPYLLQDKPLPHEFDGIETVLTGLAGAVDLPHLAIPCPETAVDCEAEVTTPGADGLRGTVSHPFINISIDVDTWWSKVTKLPLGILIPFDEIPVIIPDGSRAQADAIDIQVPLKVTETQVFDFTADPRVTLTFPEPVDYRVVEGAAPGEVQVAQGFGATEIPFEVGQTLYLTYPDEKRTPMDVASGFDLRNRFENRTSFDIESSYTTSILSASVYLPKGGVVPKEVDETAGPVFSEPITLANESFSIPLDPWEVGFSPIDGETFTLDPEDPRIAVNTSIVSGLATNTGPAGTLVQTVVVENEGDVDLLTTQVLDMLSDFPEIPGFVVNSVVSDLLTPDLAFNGTTMPATLAGQDVLGVGQSATMDVEIQVEAGNVYGAQVTASGVSPIGTLVTAMAPARFAVFPLEVEMDRLTGPGGKNAQFPIHFLNTELLDVHRIDPATVRLDGVAPSMWEFVPRNDVGPEIDLAIQFPRGDVWDRAQARAGAGILATLALAREAGGELPDPAVLADALLGGGGDPESALRADLVGNRNGRLDVGDLRTVVLAREPGGDALAAAGRPEEVTVVLPFTGTMTDGTEFVGEDALLIRTSEN